MFVSLSFRHLRAETFCAMLLTLAAVGWLPAQEKQAEPATDIVSTDLEKLNLAVKARPILPQITTQDPLRIAVHFEKQDGPIDHTDQELMQQIVDRKATLQSLDVAVQAPGAGWKLLKPAASDANAGQVSLMSSGTFFLELGSAGLKVLRDNGVEEMTLPWKWDDKLQPGKYQIALRGTLKLSTRERVVRQRGKPEEKFPATQTDIAFRTKPIRIDVARADMDSQSLEELSAAAVEAVKKLPAITDENLTVQGAESLPIADKDGNRVIRVRANMPKPAPGAPIIAGGTGYWQYEVAMSPNGKPASIARWRKGFCLAHGTTVTTLEGELPVEELRSGHQVWSFDLKSRSVVTANVLAVFPSKTNETLLINDQLRVTPEHPVYVLRDGKPSWKAAAQLQRGDLLSHREGKSLRISSIETVPGEVEVFDVAVDGPHNFFAGGLLVHNKSIAWSPQHHVPWYSLWNRAPVK